MCTCITLESRDFYFGRNLDLEYTFGDTVVVTQGRYPFSFRLAGRMERHYALIGMADVRDGYPLYAEAVNEKGLGMAGLYFPGNAFYQPVQTAGGPAFSGQDADGPAQSRVAPFELIPWLLGQAASVDEAEALLAGAQIVDIPFSEQLPNAPLHWMVADRRRCLTVEAVREGLKIYDNPFGVLTNNPPFPFHLMHTSQYLHLTSEAPANRFSKRLDLQPFGQGMGAMGLPGDASPASRFVRAAFLKENSACSGEEMDSVTQFFHILEQVAMLRGAVKTGAGRDDHTTYACCVNASRGVYYCRTYEDARIQAAALEDGDREDGALRCFPVSRTGEAVKLPCETA